MLDEISRIENSHDDATRHLDSDDLIACAMSAASEERATTIAAEVMHQGSALTIDDFKVPIPEHCGLTTKKQDNEVGLAASEMKHYLCGEPGRTKRDCPRKSCGNGGHGNGCRSRKKKLFDRKCNQRGKHGCEKADCWELESSKRSRPSG